MGGLVRRPVPLIGGVIRLLWEDGHTEVARVDDAVVVGALEAAGVRVPTRYSEVREVRALDHDEIGRALEMYKDGLAWPEIGEAYGVPWRELREWVKRHTPGEWSWVESKRRFRRDRQIWRMHMDGVTQQEIAARMEVSQTTVSRAIARIENGTYKQDLYD